MNKNHVDKNVGESSAKLEIIILSDRLKSLLGIKNSIEIFLEVGKYRVEEILTKLSDVIPNLKALDFKDVFIAVNDRVYYNLKEEVPLDRRSNKLVIFEVGAGG